MPEVAVIGAGPAGAVCALALARAGISVTLIEQHRFPRDKVCGECLSSLGIDVLQRLELIDSMKRLSPVVLNRAVLYAQDGASAEFPLPRPMLGISRKAFDQFLLECALEAGVEILQPARCESINPLRVRMLDSNQIRNVQASHIVQADGKSSATSTGDFGFKAHFQNVNAPNNTICLLGLRGHYGGIAPIEDGLWNLAFSVPGRMFQQPTRDLDALFAGFVGQNPHLKTQMHRAKRVSDWQVSPLPRFAVTKNWPAKVIPIGNAAAAIEPIGGEGMGLAMRSAEIAAQYLIAAKQNGMSVNVNELRAEYRKLWTIRQLAGRAAALVVSSPAVFRAIMPFISAGDSMSDLALRAMGKA